MPGPKWWLLPLLFSLVLIRLFLSTSIDLRTTSVSPALLSNVAQLRGNDRELLTTETPIQNKWHRPDDI
ncbi:hypothetical protein QBC45DRAFT_478016 [Copromyces sp. CBS 386.78]|nr:hypothetical protein QBC45DRAFT_478016 [Copromyces sp. CBS 386.78]